MGYYRGSTYVPCVSIQGNDSNGHDVNALTSDIVEIAAADLSISFRNEFWFVAIVLY